MLNDNAVVIGGLGVVGTATRKSLGIKDYFDLKGSTITLKDIAAKKRYIFICLPTPAKNSVHQVKPIKDIIKQIEQYEGGQHVFVVRSTTTPGQLDHMSDELGIDSIVHYPEFLTMSTWEKDILDPELVVVGARKKDYGEQVMGIIMARYSGGPSYFLTNLVTSELIKTGINSFYAMKVVFANEMYDFAQKVGADYDTFREALYARKWIGRNHLRAIFNGVRGVRGRCLPKDLDALATVTNSKLLRVVKELNKKWT